MILLTIDSLKFLTRFVNTNLRVCLFYLTYTVILNKKRKQKGERQMGYIKHKSEESMEDACRIEHDISKETFEALKNIVSNDFI